MSDDCKVEICQTNGHIRINHQIVTIAEYRNIIKEFDPTQEFYWIITHEILSPGGPRLTGKVKEDPE